MEASKEWSRNDTFQLIAVYEGNPCLWDVQSNLYRDRGKKALAWKEIGAVVERDVIECQRKIHNLRNQYSAEIKKMGKKSQGKALMKTTCQNGRSFKCSCSF